MTDNDKIQDAEDREDDVVIDPDEIERRLFELAAQVRALCEKIPQSTPEARYITARLKRSATAAALTFSEALAEEKKSEILRESDIDAKEIN